MDEGEMLGQLGVAWIDQLGELLEHRALGILEHPPDPPHRVLQVVEVAILVGDPLLPVPLVDVSAVVVVQEVVFSHGPHVGEDPLPHLTPELSERHPLPLGRRLDDLRVDPQGNSTGVRDPSRSR
jgi:hypothetical protein